MMFYQKLFKKMQNVWDMLSKKGEKQDKFIIYLLLIEVFVIILILGIKEEGDLAVALGTISMALAIVYIELIKPWLQKPKIKIEFENEAPFCRVCITRANAIDLSGTSLVVKDEYGYFIRLRIRNIGGSLAKNLRGKLVEVTKQSGELDADFDPLFLHWTTIELRQREIHPWANYLNPLDLNSTEFDYLDIFKLFEGKESEERPIKIIHTPHERGCKKDLGMSQIKNTFKITIYGENIEPVTETYKLKWDGKKYDEIKMYTINQEEANNG